MPTRPQASLRKVLTAAAVATLAFGLAVPAVLAASRGVAIQDFAFSPRTVEIRVGDSITWTNRDSVAHSANARNGQFDTELLSEGESASIRFTAPGTYRYLCRPHPEMTGMVVVRAARTGVVPPITATEMIIDASPEPTADPPIGPLVAVGGLAIVLAERLLRRRRSSP